jgi:hypothetical protein
MRLAALTLLTACWSSSKPPPAEPKPEPKEIVQPVTIEKVEDDPCGVEGGEEGGVVGGVVGGDPCGWVGAPPPPPPPPPPPAGGPAPTNVAPTLLEASRISGDRNIVPDDADKTEIVRSGKDKIIGSWKLCLEDTGAISRIVNIKSTGFPNYDRKVEREMGKWRYRAYLVNNKAVPVCTAVTFIYSQSSGGTPPPKP